MDHLRQVVERVLDSPQLTMTICFAGLYATYYMFYVVRKPYLACGDEKLRKFITSHCPVVQENYWPTWWCFESRVLTVLRAVIQSKPKVNYVGEKLITPDSGEIVLDWVENDDNSKFPKDRRPTVLLMPGLTGSSGENYILHMVHDASEMGYRSVVFNNRGTGASTLRTPRTYCAANTEDTEFVINHIKDKYPEAPLMGVGVSLGGMILFNYCAAMGDAARIEAALCISVGWNIFDAVASLDKAINYYLFNKTLAKALCYLVKKNLALFENHLGIDTAHVLRSESIKDFDERFTTKIFGYESVDHYYTDASLHTKVHRLARPVLCLSASDDPFAPHHSIPVKEAEENENIAIVVTSHGGHIGFMEGTFPRDKNYMYRWFKQYVSAVFEHGNKKA
ncbi:phospholipase ABHD3 isoform X2 [Aplysia californica]|uniref:Phospholipase ABHD3 isoform X2 n=1 Tax=Aplysia californica TaxID=6500 RepID=A0ABM1A1N2_APLCA|nr:phospholipase ABHD3 isoform X2 [Aplysia californica]